MNYIRQLIFVSVQLILSHVSKTLNYLPPRVILIKENVFICGHPQLILSFGRWLMCDYTAAHLTAEKDVKRFNIYSLRKDYVVYFC